MQLWISFYDGNDIKIAGLGHLHKQHLLWPPGLLQGPSAVGSDAASTQCTWDMGAWGHPGRTRAEEQNKASLDNEEKLQEGQMTAYLREPLCDHEARAVKT